MFRRRPQPATYDADTERIIAEVAEVLFITRDEAIVRAVACFGRAVALHTLTSQRPVLKAEPPILNGHYPFV